MTEHNPKSMSRLGMKPPEKTPTPKRWFPLWQMVLARLREFSREPAAIFWVYMFPIIMMVALGIAFRNRPVEQNTVLIQQGPQAEALLSALQGDNRFRARIAEPEETRRLLRIGKADLVIAATGDGAPTYHYYF